MGLVPHRPVYRSGHRLCRCVRFDDPDVSDSVMVVNKNFHSRRFFFDMPCDVCEVPSYTPVIRRRSVGSGLQIGHKALKRVIYGLKSRRNRGFLVFRGPFRPVFGTVDVPRRAEAQSASRVAVLSNSAHNLAQTPRRRY